MAAGRVAKIVLSAETQELSRKVAEARRMLDAFGNEQPGLDAERERISEILDNDS